MMGVLTFCLFGVLLAITAYFIVWDVKYRMIPTTHVYVCAGITLPFIVLTWIFDYIPTYGWTIAIWAVLGFILPFLWYRFMNRYIGEQDVRWLAVVFVALPQCLLILLALLIVYILITFGVAKLLKSKEMLPAMIPIGLSLVTQMVFLAI